ncbi:MAG: SpoIIE family protein phosphatase [Patescibacteria group bacterium]|jgi:serine/threonine protein phosphatase PrpC
MIRNPFEKQPHPSISSERQKEKTPSSPSPETPHDEQSLDVVPAKNVPGFTGLEVAYTLEKKHVQGKPRPSHNEDSALADPATGLMGVFDGLGGGPGGAKASAMASHVLPDFFLEERTRQALRAPEEVRGDLRAYLQKQTNEYIKLRPDPSAFPQEISALNADRQRMLAVLEQDTELSEKTLALLSTFKEMGLSVEITGGQTTACTGFVHQSADGTHYAVIANVGDSAALVLDSDGRIEQITHDDSLLNGLLESRGLSPEKLLEMKRDPAKQHNLPTFRDGILRMKLSPISYYQLSVTTMRTVGGEGHPSLTIRELSPGDTLIFCTDGVIDKYETMPTDQTTADDAISKMTDLDELASTFRSDAPFKSRVNELRLEASFRQSYKLTDDIAIVAARLKEE